MADVPSSSALQDPISTFFPSNVASAVLRHAGPHTRQVSRTYLALHPPLLALAPHSTTGTQLQAAIPTLPTTLTSLDLRAMPFHTITPHTLAAIPAALPRLQQLLLPAVEAGVVGAALRLLPACPHLHTLLCAERHVTERSMARISGVPLQDPDAAARIRSLTLPTTMVAHPPGGALPTLPHLTHLHLTDSSFDEGSTIDIVHVLPHLAAATPSLRRLRCHSNYNYSGSRFDRLSALTALSELAVESFTWHDEQHMGPLLLHVGTLTALRSLRLYLHGRTGGWTVAAVGWLPRLRLLTRLDMCVRIDHRSDSTRWQESAAAIAEVAASVEQLPDLQRLLLSLADVPLTGAETPFSELDLACGQPGSIFRRLAAATQLRHLTLWSMPLPAEEASLLTSLQGLTCLQLWPQSAPCGGLHWVSALTCLQHFGWSSHFHEPPHLTLWAAVAALPRLHTLALRFPSTYPHLELMPQPLVDLLAALQGRLERLQLLGGAWAPEVGSRLLKELPGMQRLRVLDLRGWNWSGDDEHLLQWLPLSLRQCYLPRTSWCTDGGVPQQLHAAHPWVVFRGHERLDRDVWC